MTRPSVSVIVPALEEERVLPRLLDSLIGQGAAEVLVVDGGSTDGTRAAAQSGGARVLEAPRGRGSQLAAGAREARGELLCFLHADARLEPGALAALGAAVEERGLVAAGLRQRIDGARPIYRWIERAAAARTRRGRVYGDSGLCVRRAAYEEAGGFRPIPLFEDLDLARRLRRLGPVALVEGPRILVDARRWEAVGPVRCTLRNWVLTLAWSAGVAPERLVRYYRTPARRGAPGRP